MAFPMVTTFGEKKRNQKKQTNETLLCRIMMKNPTYNKHMLLIIVVHFIQMSRRVFLDVNYK